MYEKEDGQLAVLKQYRILLFDKPLPAMTDVDIADLRQELQDRFRLEVAVCPRKRVPAFPGIEQGQLRVNPTGQGDSVSGVLRACQNKLPMAQKTGIQVHPALSAGTEVRLKLVRPPLDFPQA